MRNNETGEFELVIGNRQLLSAFFIVVLLFAVAFAMGYIFGQNSPRSAHLQADSGQNPAASTAEARPQASPPPVVDTAAPQAEPAADALPAEGTEPGAETPPSPQPTTQPARESPAAAAPAPAPPEPAPAAGTYWQVMAVNQTEAAVVVKTLKDRGFPASMSPGPNNLMRVVVGPYADTQAMGRAKTQLEKAGFHPIRK